MIVETCCSRCNPLTSALEQSHQRVVAVCQIGGQRRDQRDGRHRRCGAERGARPAASGRRADLRNRGEHRHPRELADVVDVVERGVELLGERPRRRPWPRTRAAVPSAGGAAGSGQTVLRAEPPRRECGSSRPGGLFQPTRPAAPRRTSAPGRHSSPSRRCSRAGPGCSLPARRGSNRTASAGRRSVPADPFPASSAAPARHRSPLMLRLLRGRAAQILRCVRDRLSLRVGVLLRLEGDQVARALVLHTLFE